jgi:hypothetical protein
LTKGKDVSRTAAIDYVTFILQDFRGLSPQDREARIRKILIDGGTGEMKSNQLLWRYDAVQEQVTIEHRYFDTPPLQASLSSILTKLSNAGYL